MAAAVTIILGLYWLSQLGLGLHRAAKMRRRIATQTHGLLRWILTPLSPPTHRLQALPDNHDCAPAFDCMTGCCIEIAGQRARPNFSG
jgi:hypothetical protein